jgi:hypothetical protein
VSVICVARKLRTIEEWTRIVCFGEELAGTRSQIQKFFWVRVPVRMVSVTRKLSTEDERLQDQSCLFRQEDCRNRGHNPEKCVLGLSSGDDGFLYIEN